MVEVLSRRRVGQNGDEPEGDTFAGRGLVDGLLNPCPIGEGLPSIYQEDEFCMRLTSAFDDLLAPVFATLDCLSCYLDPHIAPEDFVDWLAGWVGMDWAVGTEGGEIWEAERRRELVLSAISLYRLRGTVSGLSRYLQLYCSVEPRIEDSGGCTWSVTSGSELPGSAQPWLKVIVEGSSAAPVRRSTVDRIVADSRPAHVPYEVEILVRQAGDQSPSGGGGDGRRGETETVETQVGLAAETDGYGAAGDGASDGRASKDVAPDAPGAVVLPGSESIELAPPGPVAEGDEEAEASGEGGADGAEAEANSDDAEANADDAGVSDAESEANSDGGADGSAGRGPDTEGRLDAEGQEGEAGE